MRQRARNIGLALVILGGVWIALAYRTRPPGRLAIVVGVLFIVAGLLSVFRGRNA
jgi:hypothetical protein